MSWFNAVLMGSAIGCGGNTKGTGPLFMIPVVLLLCYAVFRQYTPRRFKMLCVMGILALAINLPQFGRNYFAFGHIGGPSIEHGGYPLYNETHGVAETVSNTTRLLAWEAAIGPQAGDPNPGPLAGLRRKFDDAMFRGLVWFHDHVLHLGINDRRTTTAVSAYGKVYFRGFDEDRTGSPLHVLLILLLPVGMWVSRKGMDVASGPALRRHRHRRIPDLQLVMQMAGVARALTSFRRSRAAGSGDGGGGWHRGSAPSRCRCLRAHWALH